MKVSLSKLQETAKDRPPDYLDAVISKGRLDGEVLDISSEALAELRAIYRPAKVEPALASIGTTIQSAASAVVAEASARLRGVAAVDAEEIARRLAICTTPCEHYRPSDDRCALCTCFASFKTRLRSQTCPAGK